MRRISIALALALVLGVVALPRAGRAQIDRVPAILAGAFEYPHPVTHGRDVIMAALEPRLAEVTPLLRGVVREQISARIAIPRRITVALDGADVSVTYEGERTITVASPLGGTTTITRQDGTQVAVRQQLSGGWLEQVYTGPNGSLRLLLSTEADGRTLHLDGTAQGERVPQGSGVRLDYRRTP
jgi:hypothetical protein